jgi:hypothetical protein
LNGPECKNGIRDQSLKKQLSLGSERTSGGIYRKAVVPEIVKQTDRISSRLQKVRDWT